jgi:hypothetical protein
MVSIAGRLNPLTVHTSPSHLFLPFLQAVHARAPLFGIWAVDWDWLWPGPPAEDWSIDRPAPLSVRRLFEVDSDSFDAEADGLSDMVGLDLKKPESENLAC